MRRGHAPAGPTVAQIEKVGALLPCSLPGTYGAVTGKETKKVAPLPSSLSAQMRPPCASTMLRAIARPRPVLFSPAVPRTVARANGLNRLVRSLADSPSP